MRRRSLPIPLLLFGSLLIGCAGPDPSAAPPEPAVACLSVPAGECLALARSIPDAVGMPPDTIRRLEIGPVLCRTDPCPRTIAGDTPVAVLVEPADGRQPTAVTVDHPVTAPVVVDRQPWGARAFAPASAAVDGSGPFPFELGHCGLYSGIDFDGSWWDPVGVVDAESGDAINAADATIAFTSPATAVLATAGGFRVDLLRHPGAKWLPGCD